MDNQTVGGLEWEKGDQLGTCQTNQDMRHKAGALGTQLKCWLCWEVSAHPQAESSLLLSFPNKLTLETQASD